jgi:S1-C subfamily serine protease
MVIWMLHSCLKKALTVILLLALASCLKNPTPAGIAPSPGSTDISLADLSGVQGRLIEIYQQVSPGVVAVRANSEGGSTVLGSGFVIDQQGHVLTNAHVVAASTSIDVAFNSGLLASSEIVGIDEASDLAVLKVDATPDNLHPLTLGDSDLLKVGQFVLAVGNPLGLKGTMSFGIISGVGREFRFVNKVTEYQAFAHASMIQTDTAINQGNSGGPLIDLNGQVIGIASSLLTSGYDRNISGVGFGTSSNMIKRIVPALIQEGRFTYPYLGISTIGDLSLADLLAVNQGQVKGIYVAEVSPDSPAAEAGILAGSQISRVPGVRSGGDLIIKVDGHEISSLEDLIAYIVENKVPGDQIVLTIIREEKQMEVEVVLGKRPG